MKLFIKRSASLIAIALLSAAVLAASACTGGNEAVDTTQGETEAVTEAVTEDVSGSLKYTVKVTDHLKNPISDVVVKVFKGDEEVKMNVVKADGSATFTLPAGDYTFSLTSPSGEFFYDESKCVLSASATEATVMLYNKASASFPLSVPNASGDGLKSYKAYIVTEGAFHATLTAGDMTYFVFTPTRSGIYEFGYISDETLEIGYYGAPINVWADTLIEPENGKIKLEIANNAIGATPETTPTYVFGIKGSATDAVFTVTRVADAPKSPMDEPWQIPMPKVELTPQYFNYDNWSITVTNLDLSDENLTVVLNENDGYYHLGTADGPLVYVRISSDNAYSASFTTMCENTRLCRYFYDENNNFTNKESYNEMILAYADACDSNGIYPLDTSMEYAIKNIGEQNKWWALGEDNPFFAGKNVVEKNAWLFACCTVEIDKTGADSEANALSAKPEGRVFVEAGKSVYLTVENAESYADVTFIDADGKLTVTCNGTPCTAADGKISVALGNAEDVIIVITASADTDVSYTLTSK